MTKRDVNNQIFYPTRILERVLSMPQTNTSSIALDVQRKVGESCLSPAGSDFNFETPFPNAAAGNYELHLSSYPTYKKAFVKVGISRLKTRLVSALVSSTRNTINFSLLPAVLSHSPRSHKQREKQRGKEKSYRVDFRY